MSGADIIKTLIELLEAQEQIKITYEIKERGDKNETIRTSAASSK